jgi:flagellar hook assembly protein FlgD
VVQASVTDSFGHTTTYNTTATVVRQETSVEVEIYNAAGEVVRHVTVAGSSGATVSQLTLSDTTLAFSGASSPGLTIRYGPGPSDLLSWDGNNADGVKVQSGTYLIKVSRNSPGAGNEVLSRSVTVLSAPGGLLADLRALPNPLTTSQPVAFQWAAGAGNLKVKALVYDLAGELVANLTNDGSVPNQILWDADKSASGIYLVRIEAADAAGNVEKKNLKVSLAR